MNTKDEYTQRWAEVTTADTSNEGPRPAPDSDMALGWEDDQPRAASFKLAASDGVSSVTHKGMFDSGVHPQQDEIEARRRQAAEVPASTKNQMGATSIGQDKIDSLARILVSRDPRMTPAAAKEMAIRMNAAKGIRVSP